MHSPPGRTTQLVRGFPIRTSSDQRFVGNSPRLNAASHVLHRPSMPRHPPYARNTHHTHTPHKGRASMTTYTSSQHELTNRAREPRQTHTSQKRKMLASTIQFSHNTHDTPHTPQPGRTQHTAATRTHMLPQTPDSAPTHQKRFVCGHILAASTPPHAAILAARVHVHLDSLSKTRWQSHPRRLNHHTHNCGPPHHRVMQHIIKAP